METQNPSQLWGPGVAIGPPQLARLEFAVEGRVDRNALKEARTDFSLALRRFAPRRLGVEFGMQILGQANLRIGVAYRVVFTLRGSSPEAEDPDETFRSLAARLAPTTLYPFVRETISGLAQKALIPGVVLPIVNFGLVFDPAEIDVPPYVPEEQLELSDIGGEQEVKTTD